MTDFLARDLRMAWRSLYKQPGFTVVAVVTLALGIGANSTMFSLVYGVLLRPLGFSESDRLALIWETNKNLKLSEATTSYPNHLDRLEQSRTFEDIGVFQYIPRDLTGGERSERVWASLVSTNLFPLLGVAPAMGRYIQPEESRPGGAPVALVSHGFWQRRSGSDPDLVGKTIRLDGRPHTVVGVMPASFRFPPPMRFGGRSVSLPIEVWTPVVPAAAEEDRTFRMFVTVGRLQRGVSFGEAQAEMGTIARRLAQSYPDQNEGWGASVVPLREQVVSHIRPAMLILLGTVGFVLLLACANLANLLLARSSRRNREFAIHLALGAGRTCLVRRLLLESLVVALGGGAAGLGLAFWTIRMLPILNPDGIPRLGEVRIDSLVLIFTLAVSCTTALLFGLAPSLRFSRPNLSRFLGSDGRTSAGSARGRRSRAALIVVEVALALVLVIGVGLLLRSFRNLLEAETGYTPRNVLAAELLLSEDNYPDREQISAFQQALLGRLDALPGVEEAGLVNMLPLTEQNMFIYLEIDGRPEPKASQRQTVAYRVVSPDYFPAMGVEILDGRGIRDGDDHDAPPVVLINQTLAERQWPGENPLGQHLVLQRYGSVARGRAPGGSEELYQIVGVVEDILHLGPGSEPQPEIYTSFLQDPWPLFFPVVRSSGSLDELTEAVRREVRELDREQAIAGITTMESRLSDSMTRQRFTLFLLTVFSCLAIVLAMLGTYGVVSYLVTQRVHEFSVRIALGATRGRIFATVLREVLILVLVGAGCGLAVAFGLTRFMSTLLYEVSVTDSVTFLVAMSIIIGIAVLAALVPARRATRVDPAIMLRSM